MRNRVSITGAAAELHWGSAVAASLGAWSVNGDPGAWNFSAEVTKSNPFRIAQRPLTVVTPNGWRWQVVDMTISGTQLTGTIEPRGQ
jgi:hypothetical protein